MIKLTATISSKGHGLGRATVAAESAAADARWAAEAAKGSTGVHGKRLDAVVRWLFNTDGLAREDYRCRSAERHDFDFYCGGHRYHGETKSGGGIVANYTGEDITEEDLFPGADIVVYAPDPDAFTTLDDVLDGCIVLTRAELLLFLAVGQRRRPNWRSGIKAAANNPALREENKRRGLAEKEAGLPRGSLGRQYDCWILQPKSEYADARRESIRRGDWTSLRQYLMDIRK